MIRVAVIVLSVLFSVSLVVVVALSVLYVREIQREDPEAKIIKNVVENVKVTREEPASVEQYLSQHTNDLSMYMVPRTQISQRESSDLKNQETFCIVTATYYRANGNSLAYLKRCAEMIFAQTYSNWRWYIVGDCYEPREELQDFVDNLDDQRIHMTNLDTPGERGIVQPEYMWTSAGAKAANTAMKNAANDGYDWIVHIDDDDVWTSDHLECIADAIAKYPNVNFVYTQSHYVIVPFPPSKHHDVTRAQPPLPANLMHSSIAFNNKVLNLSYKVSRVPGDAQLIMDASSHPEFSHAFVPVLTVYHLEEGNQRSTHVSDDDFTHRLFLGVRSVSKPGFLNLDAVKHKELKPGSLISAWGLNVTPYPLGDDSVSAVIVEDVLDQYADDQLERILGELKRILIPTCGIKISTRTHSVHTIVQRLSELGFSKTSVVAPGKESSYLFRKHANVSYAHSVEAFL